MASEIRIPRLGWSMEKGTFLGWQKKDGDPVALGDLLYELEGEKATQEIEAVDEGILRIPPDCPKPGTEIPVGSLLGYILAPGEAMPTGGVAVLPPADSAAPSPSSTPVAAAASPKPAPAGISRSVSAPFDPANSPPAAPSVRRLARELGVPISQVLGSGPAGRVSPYDVHSAAQQTGHAPGRTAPTTLRATATVCSSVASPRARRVAQELNVDWRTVPGTGREGRVRESDILQAHRTGNGSPAAASTNGTALTGSTWKMTSRRRTIADRMLASQQQTAPVTLNTRIDATNLVALRSQFKAAAAAGGLVPAFTDFIASITARVLRQHPLLASRWDEREQQFLLPGEDGLHIGIAVDTPQGLLVPVIKDVGRLPLAEVVSRSRGLIERARTGSLGLADMQGGVFTITNLGSFGIDTFTPIINSPETAILGLGAIRREVVVLPDDRMTPRDLMSMSLTFDHRVVDGAPAARFLQELCTALENPAPWLLQ